MGNHVHWGTMMKITARTKIAKQKLSNDTDGRARHDESLITGEHWAKLGDEADIKRKLGVGNDERRSDKR